MLARWSRKVVQRNASSFYLLRLRLSPYSSSSALQEAATSTSTESDSQHPGKLVFLSKPRALSIDPKSELGHYEPEFTGLSRFGLRLLGYYNKKSVHMRRARTLYSRIINIVESPSLYANFGLERSFHTTYAMLVLHMWLCLVRTKGEKPDGHDFGEALYVLFTEDLEKRVVAAGVRMLFSKWMRELEKIFYGAVKVYDEALKPDAPKDALVHALWRNVYADNDSPMPTGKEAIPVQSLAKYVRRETACLALTDKESIFSGNILFSTDKLWELEKAPK
ncbi:hypothetical protein GOP47_0003865 [Adiantum capillus-veneris]|uniref:Ubiquinol-cytochrome c chaperone domain-containing protein n=1 Tax=Adiantum capillus-veneris TaxID=13818 RepID=A0A9D4V845_ADICA|nr:hypothetical protein GOP47_0003865 [Adiantum capillus-veneris]